VIDILVLYYSRQGATEALAREIARGVDSIKGTAARLRTVPAVSAVSEAMEESVPVEGPPFVERSDLHECGGLLLGSPTRFGNMAAPLKYFLDGTGSEWLSGTMAGKPAGLFTSSSSLHGGQESTPLSMMLPLLHHGMFIVGLPYTEEDVSKTTTGGGPYGAGHVTWNGDVEDLSNEEKRLAQALGARVANVAIKLGG
jgi:NAD(P)H dehydrogenase (quinone)